MMSLDELDKKILDLLQEDAKMPYHEIGNKLDVGPTTVHARVKKLLERGIITKFTALVDPLKVGYNAFKLIGLTVQPDKIDNVASTIASFPEVTMVGTTGGDHDIVIEVIGTDERSIGKFINEKIKTIDGVKSGIGMIHVSSIYEIYKHNQKVSLM